LRLRCKKQRPGALPGSSGQGEPAPFVHLDTGAPENPSAGPCVSPVGNVLKGLHERIRFKAAFSRKADHPF
jgi:hypothetical protein